MQVHAKYPGNLPAQVAATPVYDAIRLKLRSSANPVGDFVLLHGRQPARRAAAVRAVEQAGKAFGVVAVNPVPQRLALHPGPAAASSRLCPSSSSAIASIRRAASASFVRAASRRSLTVVSSSRVICTVIAVSLHSTTIDESRQSEPLQLTLESTRRAAGISPKDPIRSSLCQDLFPRASLPCSPTPGSTRPHVRLRQTSWLWLWRSFCRSPQVRNLDNQHLLDWNAPVEAFPLPRTEFRPRHSCRCEGEVSARKLPAWPAPQKLRARLRFPEQSSQPQRRSSRFAPGVGHPNPAVSRWLIQPGGQGHVETGARCPIFSLNNALETLS